MANNIANLVMLSLSQLKAVSFSFFHNQSPLLEFIRDLNNRSGNGFSKRNKRLSHLYLIAISQGGIVKTLSFSFDPVLRAFSNNLSPLLFHIMSPHEGSG